MDFIVVLVVTFFNSTLSHISFSWDAFIYRRWKEKQGETQKETVAVISEHQRHPIDLMIHK